MNATSPEPTVDIVVATNRASPYLDEALRSVRAQTHQHWRIIVVDDGVPSVAFLEQLRADFPEVTVVRSEGKGLSAARNTGLRLGSGDWVTFLDDDDVWHPRRLEAQIEALGGAPRALGAFCGGWYMDEQGQSFGSGWPAAPTSSRDFLRGLTPLPRIIALTVSREAFEAVHGFDVAKVIWEDVEFILRVLQHGDLVAVPDRLVGYRRHPDNVTNAPLSLQHRVTEEVIKETIEAAAARGDHETALLLRENLTRYRRGAARDCCRRTLHLVRSRQSASALQDAWWSLTRAPGAVLSGTWTAITSQLRSARRPRD